MNDRPEMPLAETNLSSNTASHPELSIVTTLYNSAAFVSDFYRRVSNAANACFGQWELIFVDDGSTDESAKTAARIADEDPRVTLVELSRNFGHHQAIMAGLRQSNGERVFLIDVDLEERPEWLGDFDRVLQREDADVVYGQQDRRNDSVFNRLLANMFYWTFNSVSDTPIATNICTVRLMKRLYVDALLSLQDRCLFLGGNMHWIGFRQIPHTVEKGRRAGRSSYTLARKLSMCLNAITSFSSYPLQIIVFMGMAVTVLSVAAAACLTVWKTVTPDAFAVGWPSTVVSIWFLGGVIIALLGVIGLYLSRIFYEVKQRPGYVVRHVHSQTSSPVLQDIFPVSVESRTGSPTYPARRQPVSLCQTEEF